MMVRLYAFRVLKNWTPEQKNLEVILNKKSNRVLCEKATCCKDMHIKQLRKIYLQTSLESKQIAQENHVFIRRKETIYKVKLIVIRGCLDSMSVTSVQFERTCSNL